VEGRHRFADRSAYPAQPLCLENLDDPDGARILGGRRALHLELLVLDVEDDVGVLVPAKDTVQGGQPLLAIQQVLGSRHRGVARALDRDRTIQNRRVGPPQEHRTGRIAPVQRVD